jgi:hypothetical protein
MKTNQTVGLKTKLILITLLIAWLGVVVVLGTRGFFLRPVGSPPLPLLLGVLTPVLVFLGAFRISRAFRHFVLTFDARLGAGIQAWRFVGFGFLALYAHGILPGDFAWPAGLGDMAIGITAPWIVLALIERPNFVRNRWFIAWNGLGILDLVVAVGSGGLNSLLAHGTPGEITMGAMAEMPLVLIPAYFVPLFLMVHLSALLQAWQSRCASATDSVPLTARAANAR